MLHYLLLATLLFFQSAIPPGTMTNKVATSVLDETTVFANGDSDYQCFRIPAIIKAPNGNLLAFAEGRRTDCDDFGDVDIVLRISQDNGKTWGDLKVVASLGIMQAGNPAPVFDMTDTQFPDGRLFLVYNTGIASETDVRDGKAIREVWYKTSTDAGQTWSDAINITTQVSRPNKPSVNPAYTFTEDWRSYANTPGHALQIQNGRYKGRIFIAANHSAGPPQANFLDYRAHGFYSDDHGKSWHLSPTIDYPGGNESTAAQTPNGSLLMNIRNQSGKPKNRLLVSSPDGGQSWGKVVIANDLPDPVCEGSMLTYWPERSKPVLLFANLNSQTSRKNLTVRISNDDGKSWSAGKSIYAGSSAYSDLVVQQDGKIGILYEKDEYSRIVYTRFTYQWLLN